MGNLLARSFPRYTRSWAALQFRFKELRTQLQLTEAELWALFLTYCHAKARVHGRLTEAELAKLLRFHAQPRPLERRVFLVMKDGEDGISFRSFLVNAWAMCVQDPTSLAHMAFQLYDVGGRGCLGLADVRLMFREAFGPGFEGNPPVAQLYQRLVDGRGEGLLSAHVPLRRFLALAPAAAALLAPIFHLQRAMQTHVLGGAAWAAVRARRDAGVARSAQGRAGGFDIASACQAVNDALGARRQRLAASVSGAEGALGSGGEPSEPAASSSSSSSSSSSAGAGLGLPALAAAPTAAAGRGGGAAALARLPALALEELPPWHIPTRGSAALAEPDPVPPCPAVSAGGGGGGAGAGAGAAAGPLALTNPFDADAPQMRSKSRMQRDRSVVPVTDSHWLPASLAFSQGGAAASVEEGGHKDHPGFDRPASPGRDLTDMEYGRALLVKGVRRRLRQGWRGLLWARAWLLSWMRRAVGAKVHPAPAPPRQRLPPAAGPNPRPQWSLQ